MHSVTSNPITAAVFAALTLLMSGCIAYDALGRVADRTCIGGTADVPVTETGGRDLDGGESGFLGRMTENNLCGRRTADVAEADEEDAVRGLRRLHGRTGRMSVVRGM